MERKVIIINGPTCSGKTYLAIKLAEKLNSEILSADSRQIYSELNIGTAKPTNEELKKIKHHFIDFLPPNVIYSASKFENESIKLIEELFDKSIIPIVAGGSGLYIRALTDGIIDSVDKDEIYRSELFAIREEKGNDFLYDMLNKIDPKSAESMLPQNWKRVIRALEVFKLSGKSILDHHIEQKRNLDIEFDQYFLNWDRDILYKNIEDRVDKMIALGLVDEARGLLEKGYNKNLNSMNTVGYKEIISFLENEISFDRAVELIKRNTRRYAKRQITWCRNDEKIKWVCIKNKNDLEILAEKISKEYI